MRCTGRWRAVGPLAICAGCQLFGDISERRLVGGGGSAGTSAGQDGGGSAGAGAGGVDSGPEPDHARLFGDAEDQSVHAMVMSRATDEITLAGRFRGTLDFGSGTTPLAADIEGDVFVSRFDAQGLALWSKRIVANPLGWWSPPILEVDDEQRTLVALNGTGSVWFDQGVGGAIDESSICLARYAKDGSLDWFERYPGALDQVVADIAGSGGRIVLSGQFQGGLDFGGTTTPAWVKGYHPFVATLDETGAGVWTRVFDGCKAMLPIAVRRSPSDGSIVIAGSFSDACDLGSGVVLSTDILNQKHDCYVAKLSAEGTTLWGTKLLAADCFAADVAVAPDGDVVLVGRLFGSSPLFKELAAPDHDVFALELDSNGVPLWGRTIQRADTDSAKSVDLDGSGNVAIGALVASGTLVFELSGLDRSLLFTRELGEPTPLAEPGSFVAFDSTGKLAVAGTLANPADFGSGLLSPIGAGTSDVFVAKYSP